jgi:cysteine-rich repeat protein
MRHSSIAGLFLAATVGASLGAAMASVDLSGTWKVDGEVSAPDFGIVQPFTDRWSLTQTGSQLIRSVDGGPPVTGSIDPASGAFSFDLGTVFLPPPLLGSCGHAFVSGMGAPDSQSFTGTESSWFFKETPPLQGCHSTFSTFTGTRTCGDGVLDPGEQCDDGNRLDGDCCSSTCQLDPDGAACGEPCRVGASCAAGACTGGTPALAGTTCDDHDACTTVDTCDGAGGCAGASPVTCAPCETCDPASGGCLSAPRQGCLGGDKSTLKLVASDSGGTVSWKWRDDPSSLTPADFRAPVTDTSYAFCVFSESPLTTTGVPPGGLCGDKPCWKQTPAGAAYRAGKTVNGLKAISLAAKNGKATIKVTGRGPALGLPPSFGAVGLPLIAQLQAEDSAGGACWEDRYDAAKLAAQRITARH